MCFDIINDYEETRTNLFWQSRRCQLATIPTRDYKGDRHKAVLMLVSFDSGLDRYHENDYRYHDQTNQAEAVPHITSIIVFPDKAFHVSCILGNKMT